MVPFGGRLLTIFGLAAFLTVATASAVIADPPANAPMGNNVGAQAKASGSQAGLLCSWSILAVMVEVGKQCQVAHNAAMQVEMERTVSLIEAYVRQRSPERTAFMADYRARQRAAGAGICRDVALDMYENFSRATPDAFRRETDRFLATSPPVETGDCL